jgi:alpha-tubulin suppressor-like RCC1 family protein
MFDISVFERILRYLDRKDAISLVLTCKALYVLKIYVPTGAKIAFGSYHCVGLRANGTVITWGKNGNSQYANQPTDSDFIQIACGLHHSIGLRANGTVVTWGSNKWSQYENEPTRL